MIYFDSAATTRPFPSVIEKMTQALSATFGNPSSLHKLGLDAEMLIREARTHIAQKAGCRSEQLFFTSGATESSNWAIEDAWNSLNKKGNVLIASEADHPSVLSKLESMKKRGADVFLARVNRNGQIDKGHLEKALHEKTIFISILAVNNETGVFQEVGALSEMVRERAPHCRIHLDAVQHFLKLENPVFYRGSDYVSLSAHKIGGPKGCGALVVKKPEALTPLIYGGGQEKGKRGGTENVCGIAGFAEAAGIMHFHLKAHSDKIGRFKSLFEARVQESLTDICINGSEAERSPYISNLSIKGIRGEVLVHALTENGVILSTGAACSSKKEIFSSVLKAMNVEKGFLQGSIRISFFPDLEEEEVLKGLEILVKTVEKLRR